MTDVINSSEYTDYRKAAGIETSEKLRISFNEIFGYHYVASEDIQPGDILLKIPLASCMVLKASSLQEKLSEAGLSDLYIAACLVMKEKGLGEGASNLGTHLRVLESIPRLPNVLVWGEREEILLQGTSISDSINSIPILERWPIVEKVLRGEDDFPQNILSFSEFEHACKIMLSRGFHVAGSMNAAPSSLVSSSTDANTSLPDGMLPGPHLVPVADLLNHHPEKFCTQLALADDSFIYIAHKKVAKGDQVYTSYGALSDAALLHTYGFVLGCDRPNSEEADAVIECLSTSDRGEDAGIFLSLSRNPLNSVTLDQNTAISAGGRAAAALAAKSLKTKGVVSYLQKAKENVEQNLALLDTLGLSGVPLVIQKQHHSDSSISTSDDFDPSEFITPELATAVQVLAMDKKTRKLFATAAKEAKKETNEPLLLPLPRLVNASGEVNEGLLDAWRVLLAMLLDKIEAYPTTLAQDYVWWSVVSNGRSKGNFTITSITEPFALYKDRNLSAEEVSILEKWNIVKEIEEKLNEEDSDEDDMDNIDKKIEKTLKRRRVSDSSHVPGSSAIGVPIASEESEFSEYKKFFNQVKLGVEDELYRCSRLVAIGEKELLALIISSIHEDMMKA